MEQTKVIQYLKTFSSQEWNAFKKYLLRPDNGLNDDSLSLFHAIEPYYPKFNSPDLDKKNIYAKIYPKNKYSANKLYNLNRNLLNCIKDFLIERKRDKDENQRHRYLLEILRERGLDNYIPINIKNYQQSLEEQEFQDSVFFYEKFKLHEFIFDWTLENQNRITDAGISAVMESLEHFYMIEKLRYACAILNRRTIVADSTEIHFMNEILTYCEEEEIGHIPLLQVYYFIYQMLASTTAASEEFFERLRSFLRKSGGQLEQQEMFNAYSFCLNFCIKQYKSGKTEYLRKMLPLYKEMIDRDLLVVSGTPANLVLKNIVSLGIKLNEYEWAEAIIRQSREQLPEKFRDNTVAFNLANIFFAKGNYHTSLKYLNEVSFIDPFYRINYDMLLMKNYYEIEEYESLLARCHTFYTYLKRDKTLSKQNQDAYLNMARFIKKLTKFKLAPNKNADQLSEEFHNFELIVEREWLANKVKELV